MADWKDFSALIKDKKPNETEEVASLRPILYVGLGGFGCSVIRNLKQKIQKLIPEHKDGFAFIGLDTNPAPADDVLSRLEYVPLSLGVHPDTVSKQHSDTLGWYRDLMGNWKARNIATGADKVRGVGRLAFMYPPTFNDYITKLNSAYNKINKFREDFNLTIPPKIYVISTLAGGTGSGCLLDVYASTVSFLRQNVGADLKLQALVVTPEALQEEAPAKNFPEFYANTYAALKEVHHFFCGGELVIGYDDAAYQSVKVDAETMPDPIFLITDRNEDKKAIVDNFQELGEMVVSYLLFEIKTPIKDESGQPKPQDRENPDFDGFGQFDMPKAFSSLGVVQVGFPFGEVCQLFTADLINKALTKEMQKEDVNLETDNWISENKLVEAGTDQFQEELKKDTQGNVIRISLDVVGALDGVKRDELAETCKELMASQEKYLKEQQYGSIEENGTKLGAKADSALINKFNIIFNSENVGTAVAFLASAKNKLQTQKNALNEEYSQAKKTLSALSRECLSEISAVSDAAASGIIGRKHRIKAAVSTFEGVLEAYINKLLEIKAKEVGLQIYSTLITKCDDHKKEWDQVLKVFEGRVATLHQIVSELGIKINKLANITDRGLGNRFSLVDFDKVMQIYAKFVKPSEEEMTSIAQKAWRDNNLIKDAKKPAIEWIQLAAKALTDQVESKICDLTIVKTLDTYYPREKDKRDLFREIGALASPLFPMDANRKEAGYHQHWIIAIHPDLKDDFIDGLAAKYLAGEGRMHAFYENPYEVIIYSIKHGYTLFSLSQIDLYHSHYANLQDKYERLQSQKKPARAIHAWPDAIYWDNIIPRETKEEGAFETFVVGWGFSCLYPTTLKEDGTIDEKRNRSYIYQRGSYFYFYDASKKDEVKLGQGIEDSVKSFSDHADWINYIEKLIEKKVVEVGSGEIINKLKDFRKTLDEKINTSKDNRLIHREKILRKLMTALDEYIKRINL